MVELVDTLS